MDINPRTFLQSENNRLTTENEQLREELRSLREFIKVLNSLLGEDTQTLTDDKLLPMLNRLFKQTLHMLNAPDGSLLLMDEDTNELVFLLVHGELGESLKGYRIPADEGIAGWVVRHTKTALVRDVRMDMRFSHLIDEEFKFRTQSILAAPLVGDGKVLGVIEALNQPGDDPFDEMDETLITMLCRAAGERLANIEHGG